ncbi:Glycosyltransferase involved in cell wall bisynthesis [Roseomonas rosea]|uniref:Glycosyltransferase involved in cell wall bisynthesis n=1 Tax=Muricoccus roseus TaxID=198092 RepID=A0A1M6DDG2_9PROT|nr:glycosyltransferase [Roseomonas rosea]SHI71327.1 Glycosyltransferase involved in cell wall bisynthesis [Roseomonas rosea]
MKVLLVHPNFPGQYAHLLPALAARRDTQVVGIGARQFPVPEGVSLRVYEPPPPPAEGVTRRARAADAAIARAERAAHHALDLRRGGFIPDVVFSHIGWGDTIFLKDVFPEAALLLYAEFFYSATGADVGYEPGKPSTIQDAVRVRAMNMPLVSAMNASDWGIAPTAWQRARFPEWYHSRISLVHEGIDTELCRPDPDARFDLPDGSTLRPGDEVVTYVARGLEPYRGFPTFMRALPALLAARPQARVVIVGGDEVRYGRSPEGFANWREAMLAEVGPLDPARVHFLGRIPHPALHALFRVSSVHIYLTVPFVLSWSVLEAMACGALILGSATPPVQEVIVDGKNGLLTDLFDHTALARRTAEVLADPRRFAPMRAAARRTIEDRYDLWRVCLPRQVQVLESLAARRRPPTFA